VQDVNGTEAQEERGKQDLGQKATTSPFAEALSQTTPSTNKAGTDAAAIESTASQKPHKAKAKK
jgi:hypothetical protein